MEAIVILTNLPDRDSAQRLAKQLVATKIAACVNIMAPCVSTYRWRGTVESATEVPVLIKTRRCHYDAVERVIRACHPYALPEIIALPVVAGLADYLDWIATETTDGA
ncbi:divalent-cation tolerance protein CutA [Sulfuriferula plumbiphila]|uniref:Divalent-cation tolerance protein CutA n=1 Tax=Sulfuriferula plumbiphila TaxID=171865 RepID=A0A512L3H3_9PROT|nr:divalent-cation tolerance protein CutA [Sulfuriferula plumbiphila]BBP02731.1 divalent-cation tolerance protein CutA [Sulfuriferula plumbiphila]GEP29025.1 divalent-cation tolerance protein CutA [Sulfuriferula plumbiphila]